MTDFIEGEARTQSTLFPERLDDYIDEENAVRVIDVFLTIQFQTPEYELGNS